MPCYEPPPEWAGDARENAETAVKILCAMVQSASNYSQVPKPLLEWYMNHRLIDLEKAKDPRFAKYDDLEVRRIVNDIQAIEVVLAS
jgi:hypothetical protein